MGCSLRLRIGGTWQGQETLLGWVLIACPLCALNVFGAGLMSVPDESPRARFLTRGRGSYARCATSLAFKIPKSIQMGFLYVADMVPARSIAPPPAPHDHASPDPLRDQPPHPQERHGAAAEARGGAAPAEPQRPARPVASGRSPSGVVRVSDGKSNKRRPPAFKCFFLFALQRFGPCPVWVPTAGPGQWGESGLSPGREFKRLGPPLMGHGPAYACSRRGVTFCQAPADMWSRGILGG